MARKDYTHIENMDIKTLYLKNPSIETVKEISIKFRRTKMSIVTKLVAMGVYQRAVYLSKDGTVPRSKKQRLENLSELLLEDMQGLALASKAGLNLLENTIISLLLDNQQDLARKDALIGVLEAQIVKLRTKKI